MASQLGDRTASPSVSPSSSSSSSPTRMVTTKTDFGGGGETQLKRRGSQGGAFLRYFTLKSDRSRRFSAKVSGGEARPSEFWLKSSELLRIAGENEVEMSGSEKISRNSGEFMADINNNVVSRRSERRLEKRSVDDEDEEGDGRGDATEAEKNGKIEAGSKVMDAAESPITINTTNIEAKDEEDEEESKGRRRRRRRRGRGRGRRRRGPRRRNDLSLWIDGRQVKMFSGYVMEIFAIHDGHVLPYILDPNFEKHLPVIPSEVESVNFTWQAGRKRYDYKFDRLYSQDEDILHAPVVSMATHGRVPKKPKVFTINMECTGNVSGVATFGIGLLIQSLKGKPLPGTPLRLQLRKECMQHGPDPECDEKCLNGGVCDGEQRCLCPEGYMGQYCHTALCYPQCMNGGTCTTPGRCSCPPGFQGRHCEGGICRDKCENGGKCVQKDTCECPRGYYGNRCEFSKCVIPCVNGGRCRDVNKCRCPHGFAGDHCEVALGQVLHSSVSATALNSSSRCSRKCRNGACSGAVCECEIGYSGRWCRRRSGKAVRRRIWL